MDYEWARQTLLEFIELCDAYRHTWPFTRSRRLIEHQLAISQPIVQEIMNRVMDNPDEISHLFINEAKEDVRRALGFIDVFENDDRLGPPSSGTFLLAADLHPWVWDAASSFWESGHYAEAVTQAWKSINAHLQTKIDRRDVSDDALINEALSPPPPGQGKTKARIAGEESDASWTSRQRGMHLLGQSAAAGIRNVLAHSRVELDTVEALEYLAVLSVLARWIDEADAVAGA